MRLVEEKIWLNMHHHARMQPFDVQNLDAIILLDTNPRLEVTSLNATRWMWPLIVDAKDVGSVQLQINPRRSDVPIIQEVGMVSLMIKSAQSRCTLIR